MSSQKASFSVSSFHCLGVAEDALEAAAHEGLDPVGEDRVAPGDAELLLDLDLDREPVGVPARAAGRVVSAHRPVTRKHVLHHAREHVPVVRHAVRGGRPFVEDEAGTAAALREGLAEDVGVAPELPDPRLGQRKVDDRCDLLEAGTGHGAHRLPSTRDSAGAADDGLLRRRHAPLPRAPGRLGEPARAAPRRQRST